MSRYRQGLSFQAQVPNFLKRMRESEKPVIEREERPEREDEKPTIVLAPEVNAHEAREFLEKTTSPKKLKTTHSKKEQLAQQKREKQQKIKSIKNKQLLSFDDE
jgi:hypothetical protein